MVLKKYQVPGTVPSGKPPKSEPYRTAPCRTMQWKSATRLSSGKDHWNTYNLTLMELEQTTGSSGQRGTTSPPPPPPRLSLISPKVFSPFCHQWSFGSLPLSPLACLVGETSHLTFTLYRVILLIWQCIYCF